MKSTAIFLIFILISFSNWAQFQVETRSQIPEAVSNNPVCGAVVNGQKFGYTFGGIDTTKIYSGIHNRSYKYDVANDSWVSLPDLPDNEAKIAAGASFVNNMIYIIGGYQVLSNGNEITHNTVHRFDVTSDTFISDGAPLPTPTDDHVQAVYQDSLIFVVTGWNTNTNIPNVQIYNPTQDIWLIGSPLPNTNYYKSFGASGSILGDTLYYFGGARYAHNFPAQREIRKGWINPQDPTDITWSIDTLHMDLVGYRMAATSMGNKLYWIGGSDITYNYNGIGYQGSIPVEPNHRVLSYFPSQGTWDTNFYADINMDFRGIASFSNELLLIGGMENNQQVSSKTLRLYTEPNGNTEENLNSFQIYPNPATTTIKIEHNNHQYSMQIFNLQGQLIRSYKGWSKTQFSIEGIPPGMYLVKFLSQQSKQVTTLLIQP